MENVIEGRVIQVLQEQRGTSKSGKEWRKQIAVLETAEQYPRRVAFQMFNTNIVYLNVGDMVQARVNIESREWEGKWYTDLNAYGVQVFTPQSYPQQGGVGMMPQSGGYAQQVQQQAPHQGWAPQQPSMPRLNDDIPF